MADDLGLPKSSLQKAIKDLLPGDMRIAGDASDLLVACCNQFVHLVSTQANAVSEREKRSTISPEHVVKALEELEFGRQYVEAAKAGGPSCRRPPPAAAAAHCCSCGSLPACCAANAVTFAHRPAWCSIHLSPCPATDFDPAFPRPLLLLPGRMPCFLPVGHTLPLALALPACACVFQLRVTQSPASLICLDTKPCALYPAARSPACSVGRVEGGQ